MTILYKVTYYCTEVWLGFVFLSYILPLIGLMNVRLCPSLPSESRVRFILMQCCCKMAVRFNSHSCVSWCWGVKKRRESWYSTGKSAHLLPNCYRDLVQTVKLLEVLRCPHVISIKTTLRWLYHCFLMRWVLVPNLEEAPPLPQSACPQGSNYFNFDLSCHLPFKSATDEITVVRDVARSNTR